MGTEKCELLLFLIFILICVLLRERFVSTSKTDEETVVMETVVMLEYNERSGNIKVFIAKLLKRALISAYIEEAASVLNEGGRIKSMVQFDHDF